MSESMLLIAAATTLEKIQKLPMQFWLKFALFIAAFIVGVIILKKIAGMNKAVLGAILFVVVTVMGFNWIYERNEPAWATPVVEKLANFFPSKGSYEGKQGR
jgi:hypothetical protein